MINEIKFNSAMEKLAQNNQSNNKSVGKNVLYMSNYTYFSLFTIQSDS